jgi:hypothetical protein
MALATRTGTARLRCPRSAGALRAALWLVASVLTASIARGQPTDPPPLENKVKAACLFNFALNTEWPEGAFAGPEAPLVIGLAGDVPFASTLEHGVQGKTIRGRRVEVRRLPEVGVTDCHVIFIAPSESGAARGSSLMREVAQRPILLVGEVEGFTQLGGIINFRKVEGSVKFEVNTAAAARAKLKLGSQLLKLAILSRDGQLATKE